MFTVTLHVEIGEAGLREVVESARTGVLSPVAWVVLRNLSLQAVPALQQCEKGRAVKPRPISIREEWRKAA